MKERELEEVQEYYDYDMLQLLARAILLDKVKIVNGRIKVEPLE
jgi:hypothetical protein